MVNIARQQVLHSTLVLSLILGGYEITKKNTWTFHVGGDQPLFSNERSRPPLVDYNSQLSVTTFCLPAFTPMSCAISCIDETEADGESSKAHHETIRQKVTGGRRV